MPNIEKSFNYSWAALSAWLKGEISRYKDEGRLIEDFREDLDYWYKKQDEGDEGLTKNTLDRLRGVGRTAERETRIKSLPLGIVKAIAAYEKEDVETTIGWLDWSEYKSKSRTREESLMLLNNRLRALSTTVDELKTATDELRARVRAIEQAANPKELHPLVAALHEVIRQAGKGEPDSISKDVRAVARKLGMEKDVDVLLGDGEPLYRNAMNLVVITKELISPKPVDPAIYEYVSQLAPAPQTEPQPPSKGRKKPLTNGERRRG